MRSKIKHAANHSEMGPDLLLCGELVGYLTVLMCLLFSRTDGAAQQGHVPHSGTSAVQGMEEACAVSVRGLDKAELHSSQLEGRIVS